MRSRTQQLAATLLEAGLAGRVRVGALRPVELPPPVDPGRSLSHPPASTRRTEEGAHPPGAQALDPLLGLHARASRGRLIEIAGGVSSGRTALVYRMAGAVTARGELASWVDLPDALDPRFLRRAGVHLERMLWVRPPTLTAALRAAEILTHTGFALVVLDLEGASQRELGRLGPAVWTRLAQRLRNARATLALLASRRIAGSFATLGIETERTLTRFERGLFEGLESHACVVRNRTGATGTEHPFAVYQRPS